MNKDNIITLPNPTLRSPSKKVGLIDDSIVKLVEDMKSATIDWEDSREHEVGVALAAVQIDVPLKLVIVREDFDDKSNKDFLVLVNPKITKTLGEPIYDYEGCLSVKNIYGLVPRYPKIKVKATTLTGKEIRLTAEGFLARVLQHEIDHTKGIVFVDKVKDNNDFYKLSSEGKLIKADEKSIKKAGILG